MFRNTFGYEIMPLERFVSSGLTDSQDDRLGHPDNTHLVHIGIQHHSGYLRNRCNRETVHSLDTA